MCRGLDGTKGLTGVDIKPFLPFGSDRLVGLVVKASASRAEDPGFESHLVFCQVESYQ